jgi:hypothetical protein
MTCVNCCNVNSEGVTATVFFNIHVFLYVYHGCLQRVFAAVCVQRQGLLDRQGIDTWTHEVWVELCCQYMLCFCHFEFDHSAEQVIYKYIHYQRIVYSFFYVVAKPLSWPVPHSQFVVFFLAIEFVVEGVESLLMLHVTPSYSGAVCLICNM